MDVELPYARLLALSTDLGLLHVQGPNCALAYALFGPSPPPATSLVPHVCVCVSPPLFSLFTPNLGRRGRLMPPSKVVVVPTCALQTC